ncbi:Hypothetical protein ORPV_146 [Orpheovirus IHUMI-LCC2]|uniref:Uncharacterized protein n=1 Tax=Orpheovirus IHUMI-LCC2 TaxID=2023057 RepID=A0A2I2L3F8_9VIRU|nr:Hypothetical protein ORPV_146 [Orpheovirus IHUMI-LCC2]SNW62050.1 Hypothetical protein ORPV_146 [Orpheovirus IHUMI-LCC2]
MSTFSYILLLFLVLTQVSSLDYEGNYSTEGTEVIKQGEKVVYSGTGRYVLNTNRTRSYEEYHTNGTTFSICVLSNFTYELVGNDGTGDKFCIRSQYNYATLKRQYDDSKFIGYIMGYLVYEGLLVRDGQKATITFYHKPNTTYPEITVIADGTYTSTYTVTNYSNIVDDSVFSSYNCNCPS